MKPRPTLSNATLRHRGRVGLRTGGQRAGIHRSRNDRTRRCLQGGSTVALDHRGAHVLPTRAARGGRPAARLRCGVATGGTGCRNRQNHHNRKPAHGWCLPQNAFREPGRGCGSSNSTPRGAMCKLNVVIFCHIRVARIRRAVELVLHFTQLPTCTSRLPIHGLCGWRWCGQRTPAETGTFDVARGPVRNLGVNKSNHPKYAAQQALAGIALGDSVVFI